MQLNCSSKALRSCARAPPRTSSLTGPHHAASYSSKRPSSASFTLTFPSRRNASIHTDESTSTMNLMSVQGLYFSIGGWIIKRAFPQHPPEVLRLLAVDEITHGESHRWAVLFVPGD